MQSEMKAKHWAVLLLTGILFGSAFLFTNIAVSAFPPVTVAALRALIAVPIAWGFLKFTGAGLPPLGRDFARNWGPLLVLGLLTAVIPYTAIAWGQVHIESGLAGILFGTIPVFSVLLVPVLARDERLTAGRLAGAGLGLLGVVVVVGPSALASVGDQLFGTLVTLAAALSYVLGSIYARTQKGISPTVMTAGQLVTASLVLIPASLIFDAPWTLAPSPAALAAVAAVAAVAVLSTAAPALLLFWLIRNAGASNGSLVAFVIPVVAVALGAAVLGEALPWPAFVGLGLILLGAAAVGGRLRFPARRKPTPSAAQTK